MTRALLPILFLTACAPQSDTDLAGNVYPPECTVAAAIAEPAARIAMDPVILGTFSEVFGGKRVEGAWLPPFNGGLATIFYDETARGWELADIQRHEGCHGIRWRLTGDSRWHP